ncbi:MAG TPA: AraC family transcriptional regulator [Stellaceae bacterium]|nr:AraC family transcriptional regulator [Stellaceae bacterium]
MVEGQPLSAHPSFEANTVDQLCQSIDQKLGAACVRVGERSVFGTAGGNLFRLPSTDLWFCSYGLPITLKFAESDFFRVQFHRKGVGATSISNERLAVTATQSCITSRSAEVDFGLDFEQFAWRLPRPIVHQKMAALIGRPVNQPVEFDYLLDMSKPQSMALREIFNSLIFNIDAATSNFAKIVLPELENALVTSLLATAQHNYRGQLDGPVSGAAPWQVSRAESYIEAHWNEPIMIEDLVSVTGVSARSIFRAFKKSRGYSPFQFVKEIRLTEARRMLNSDNPSLTVTEVAVACGFENLSRFSKDFSLAFGEPPSAVKNRRGWRCKLGARDSA